MSTAPCTFSSSQFQFALPRGERRSGSVPFWRRRPFQFALPRGERRFLRLVYIIPHRFNSRSREGSDACPATARRAVWRIVSIRAPARGATAVGTHTDQALQVSIRAPARGATRMILDGVTAIMVSIRAPARGATRRPARPARPQARFNSRSREGSDIGNASYLSSSSTFQFALPRGERRRCNVPLPAWKSFNSRSREGSDGVRGSAGRTDCRFNSRSREGSDARRDARASGNGGFNSRSREGSDAASPK